MRETQLNFNDFTINPRIISAAKQCGLLSAEAVLYNDCQSRPSHLSSADQSQLLKCVAALYCPKHYTAHELLLQEHDASEASSSSSTLAASLQQLRTAQNRGSDSNSLCGVESSECHFSDMLRLDQSVNFKSNILQMDVKLSSSDTDVQNSSKPKDLEFGQPDKENTHSFSNLPSLFLHTLPHLPFSTLLCPRLSYPMKALLSHNPLLEVCGESGSGKTQLALSIALHFALPQQVGGCGGKVAYLCTEGLFPSSRLRQLVAARLRRAAPRTAVTHDAVADAIFVKHIEDLPSLLLCVQRELPALLARHQPLLVVLDSVAALFRATATTATSGSGGMSWRDRQSALHTLGYTLRLLAAQHRCPVLVLNQVSARCEQQDLYGLGPNCSVTPSLGLAWSTHVTSRVMLHRTSLAVPGNLIKTNGRQNADDDTGLGRGKIVSAVGRDLLSDDAASETSWVREGRAGSLHRLRLLRVLFCPWLPRLELPYVVLEEGVQGVGSEWRTQACPAE